MKKINKNIVCAYLYIITKYGYPPDAERTCRYIEEMAEMGFKSIELEGIREQHLLKVYEIRQQVKQKITGLHLEVPYFCAVLPGLSSPDKKERKKQLRLFEKGCEIAALLGSHGILDNAPLPPYVFPENIPVARHYSEDVIASAFFPRGLTWKAFWKYLAETYREACDIAAGYGLTYQMHPAVGVLSSNTDGFLYFYDAVGRNNLRFNFDTANLFVIKENLSIALRRLAEHIDYIHLSDNRGIKVEHLPPGKGIINWKIFFETLKDIKFKGYIGLDIGGAETGVKNIRNAYTGSAAWLSRKWKS
jgi:sugar phosphate isomerase/epimerase